MNDPRNRLETKAAELGATTLEWNELDFVGWKEFRRMAPAVVGLETARVERVMATLEPGSDAYNTLVRARHEMHRFSDGLDKAPKDVTEARADHLRRALLAIALLADTNETLQYTIHRLRYIHERLKLIY